MDPQVSDTSYAWPNIQATITKFLANLQGSQEKQSQFTALAHDNYFQMNSDNLRLVAGNTIFRRNPEAFGLTSDDAGLIAGYVTANPDPEIEKVLRTYFPESTHSAYEYEEQKSWYK